MNERSIANSRAFGKVVVTVHGDVDGQQLARTIAELPEDPGSLHLIIDLRDADSLDQESLTVLSRTARQVRDAGGGSSSRLAHLPFLTPSRTVS